MANVLVLGAGPSQLDLIKSARELGCSVYACGQTAKQDVLNLLDGYKTINIIDDDAVYEYAKEINADCIFTMGLEIALPTIARVSRRLDLPYFFSEECLNQLKNKAMWREILGDIDGNLAFMSGSSLEDFKSWDIYPAFLKPADGSGQRGVHKVDNPQQLAEVFNHALENSRNGILILEEFADGEEISVNSFMYNNELAVSIPSDRISYSEYPGGIIKEHHIPSKLVDAECEKRIFDLVENVNRKMGFENGHIYFQIKVKDGIPKLIEFTPRFDGCHMWRLVRYATGIDLLKASLEWLLNDGVVEMFEKTPEYKSLPGVFKTKFISDKPGTRVVRSNYKLQENPLCTVWYYEDDEQVKKVTGFLEKVGYIMVREDESN